MSSTTCMIVSAAVLVRRELDGRLESAVAGRAAVDGDEYLLEHAGLAFD